MAVDNVVVVEVVVVEVVVVVVVVVLGFLLGGGVIDRSRSQGGWACIGEVVELACNLQ